MKNKSTNFNLISFYQHLTYSVEQNLQIDAVSTDFSAGFDEVNTNILCCKLQAIGISDPLLSWFFSYLSNRTQIVRYSNSNVMSHPFEVNSGCPQGGHLSGCLFNIYINDILQSVQNVCSWLFAEFIR